MARTAKQRAALRKAQLASARKRKRHGIKSRAKRHVKKYGAVYKGLAIAGALTAAGYGLRRTVKRHGRLVEYKHASKMMAATARQKFKTDKSPGRRATLRMLTSRKSYALGKKHVGRW